MNKFEQELKKGNFVTSECNNCNIIVWPPSNYCSSCFNDVIWRPVSKKGKLIEFSKKDNHGFCVVEFENKIRILSTFEYGESVPKIGQDLKLENCGMHDGVYSFTVSAEN